MTCSTGDLATILNMSRRALQEWANRGVVIKTKVIGQYKTLESIHGYVKSMREQAAGRGGAGTGLSLTDERALTEKITRRREELKLKTEEGELLSVEEIEQSWVALAAWFKAAVLSLPSALSQQLPHLTPHDRKIMREVCRDKLRDMAEEAGESTIGADPKALLARLETLPDMTQAQEGAWMSAMQAWDAAVPLDGRDRVKLALSVYQSSLDAIQ